MSQQSEWFISVENALMDKAGIDYQYLSNRMMDLIQAYEGKVDPDIMADTLIKYMNNKQETGKEIEDNMTTHITELKRLVKMGRVIMSEQELRDFIINILTEEKILPVNTREPLQEIQGHGQYDRIIFPKMASITNSSRLTREVSAHVTNSFNERQKLDFIQWLNLVKR